MGTTKTQITDRLKEAHDRIAALEEELRRAHRLQGQLRLDLKAVGDGPVPERRVYPSDQARLAIERAEAEWELNVTEPEYKGNWQRINTYIKGREGLGWTWEPDYTKNGQFAWCGAFASFAYGDMINFPIKQKIFPSCLRLWNAWGKTARCRDGEKPLPGDIVVVFNNIADKSDVQGNHITLCVEAPNDLGLFSTIEGNARGEGPSGRIEGVIRRQRDVTTIAHIYRLLPEDFEER
jgi:hypothetical protein